MTMRNSEKVLHIITTIKAFIEAMCHPTVIISTDSKNRMHMFSS